MFIEPGGQSIIQLLEKRNDRCSALRLKELLAFTLVRFYKHFAPNGAFLGLEQIYC